MNEPQPPRYTLWQMVLYFLRLGALGFGGPVALVGYMQRDLVESRGWITQEDFKEGLALAQMAPGPLAAQLGIYLGFVHYRLRGATLAGIAFVLPSFFMVVALGWAYLRFGGLAWMQAVFYGVGAAVVGVIAMSAKKLTTKTLGKDKLLWAVFLTLVAVTVVTESEVAWLFIAGGALVWLLRAPPKWLGKNALGIVALDQAPVASGVLAGLDVNLLTQLAIFFGKAGAFVFGSGLAIVPFLYGGVVTQHHWLTEKQFVDAVAVAMITPGPVVITVGFIGYLVAGFAGAAVAALATFIPCYLFTVIPAPYFKRYGKLPGVVAFVDGITAAAIGAITGSVVVLARRSIFDIPTVLVAAVTILLLWRFKKLPEPLVITAAAVVGLVLFPGPVAATALPTTAAPAAAQGSLLQLVGDYPLPGRTTRWDYMTIDPAQSRLVMAHLGDSAVVVADMRTKAVLGRVAGVSQVHGVLAVPALHRIYATATGSDELVAIDGTDLRVLARVPVGRYPDGLAFAASAGKIYVSDKEGKTESVIDTRTNKRVATIDLGGAVGNSQYDPVSGHVFVNVEGTGELVEIDPVTDKIVKRIALPHADGNHGLLIAPTLRLAFVACEGNDKLLVVDLRDRRVKAEFNVAGEPDVLAYDVGLGILYVATESGPVHLFRVRAGAVDKLGEVRVGPNAHSVAVDPASHEVYFPLREAGGRPVLRVMRPGA